MLRAAQCLDFLSWAQGGRPSPIPHACTASAYLLCSFCSGTALPTIPKPVLFPWDPAAHRSSNPGPRSPEECVLPAIALPSQSCCSAQPSLSHCPPRPFSPPSSPTPFINFIEVNNPAAIPLSPLNSNFLLSQGADQQSALVKWQTQACG